MSRWWKLCSLVAATGGCASSSAAPAFESVVTLPDEPRVPAGADVARPTLLPAPEAQGTTADGLTVLKAPIDPRKARSTVDAFFHAVIEESPSALDLVLAPDAVVRAGPRREAARSYYVGRFVRMDYRSLRGETLYHPGDVETWEGAAPDPRGTPAPLEPAPNQVVVRVHITLAWGGRPRVFGDELVFRLEPRGASFVILEIVEAFQPT